MCPINILLNELPAPHLRTIIRDVRADMGMQVPPSTRIHLFKLSI